MTDENRPTKRLTENLLYYADDPYQILVDLPGTGISNVRFKKNTDLALYGLSDEEIAIVQVCRDLADEKITKQQYTDKVMQMSKAVREKQGLDFLQSEKEAEKSMSKPTEVIKRINTDLSNTTEQEAYEMFDLLDTEQIVKYFETSLAQEYFYQFSIENKEVIGISYAGTIAIARTMSARNKTMGLGGIEILHDVQLVENEDLFRAYVWARDNATGLTVMGYAENKKNKKVWISKQENTFRMKEDPFASTIAISKATRNAIRHLIPEKEIIILYEEWEKSKK